MQPSRQVHHHHNNNEENIPTFKLSHLPLRPSTLSLLTRRGFNSTIDVYSSKNSIITQGGRSGGGSSSSSNSNGVGGGISNFASELGISITEAVQISHEVQCAIQSLIPPKSNHGSSYSSSHSSSTCSTDVNNRHGPLHHQQRRAPLTAAQILSLQYKEPMLNRPIISFVRSIDSLLGGGFQTGEVVEISGLPGVGKTQLAMQLCVDTHLPKQFGGTEGESIYIDSEGSFSPERCHDMAKALVDHVKHSAKRSKNDARKVVPADFNTDSILDSIHVFRVFDETCQSATILSLPKFLNELKEKGKMVKLIVIDSIAFHYRCSSSDYKSRTKSLTTTAAFLSDLANTFDLCVLVINQMTTKIGSNLSYGHNDNSTDSLGSPVVPALGESWAHATTTRILLAFDDMESNYYIGDELGSKGQRRICKLIKSPHKAAGMASFMVTEFGLRDCIS